jgi:hypothetical protein
LAARLRPPVIKSAFLASTGFTSPVSIQIDNAIGFNSVRFSTDSALARGVLNPVNSAVLLRQTAFQSQLAGCPRPVARVGVAGGGRCATRRR